MKSTLCSPAWWEDFCRANSLRFLLHLLFLPPPSHVVHERNWHLEIFRLSNDYQMKEQSNMPHPVKCSVFKHLWNYLLAFVNIHLSLTSVKEQAEHETKMLWKVMAQNCKQFNQVSFQKNMSNECKGSLPFTV